MIINFQDLIIEFSDLIFIKIYWPCSFQILLILFLIFSNLFHLSFQVYLYIGYHPFWLYSTTNFAGIKMETCINV